MIFFSDYYCPDGYHILITNLNADVEHLATHEDLSIEECKEKCSKKCNGNGKECADNDDCDLLEYHHSDKYCDLLQFKRRSFVLEIGLTSDAIFCMKPSNFDKNFMPIKNDSMNI